MIEIEVMMMSLEVKMMKEKIRVDDEEMM